MSGHKKQPRKRVRKRRASGKVTEVFEDCTVTIQGNRFWMSGPLVEDIAEVGRRAGMNPEEALNLCVRAGLPKVVAEFQRAADETKAAKVKKSKASRGRGADEMI